MRENDYVTIYGPEHEHDDAYIYGTREGLKKLRDSINEALINTNGRFESEFTEAFDGEGYGVIVRVMDFNEMSSLPPQYIPKIPNWRKA